MCQQPQNTPLKSQNFANSQITSKELEQAKAIVEKRGMEKARFVMAYRYDRDPRSQNAI
jgi:hypothetical protein